MSDSVPLDIALPHYSALVRARALPAQSVLGEASERAAQAPSDL